MKTNSTFHVRFALTMLACMFAFMQTAWAESSRRTTEQLPAVAGFTLQPNKMYVVSHDMTITATHGSGLNVATVGNRDQAPILYIPQGVTLTVKGAAATGQQGAGAGIYLPTTAKLIITGGG